MFCAYLSICGECAFIGQDGFMQCYECVYLVDEDDCAVNDID